MAFSAALAAVPAGALPTRSSPLAVAPDGHVFVVNPDSSTVARLDFAPGPGALTHERGVGRYPRRLALDAAHVFTAGQQDDTLWRLDQADLGNPLGPIDLGFGCAPYGVAVTPAGDRVLVTCQGTRTEAPTIPTSALAASSRRREIGCICWIATSRLHWRGPMGVESLTTMKWIVDGDGQTRD